MTTSPADLATWRKSADRVRARVHDLRNLFAVVASAKSFLERPLDEHKKKLVIDTLARVATDGRIVTDALLVGETEERACGSDTRAELLSLAPVIHALDRPGLRIELAFDDEASWILMAPAEFRAVVLELVTNAVAAGAHQIQVRTARRGCRYWLVVADDGSGFGQSRATSPTSPAGLHGTGMRRLASAVGSARGKIRIRTQPRRGSVIALVLPIIRIVADGASNRCLVDRFSGTATPSQACG